jgi:hypothetical protein
VADYEGVDMADFTPQKCAVEDCPKLERQWRRGWCSKHYERWRRHGDPNYYHWTDTPWDRFWPKVDAAGICWEWRGTCNRLGYGQFSIKHRHVMAHRVAWELLVGPIPDGLELDHLCRNHGCVNPDHLEPVTHAENMRRAPWTAVQIKRAQTHCKRGHPFAGDNVHLRSSGRRTCRSCDRDRSALRRKNP